VEVYKPVIEPWPEPLFASRGIRVALLRDDVWGGPMQGNKWRKLRYNLEEFRLSGKKYMLSFGGAFSNHLYATAWAGKKYGIPVRMIVRGEEPAQWSPTLKDAAAFGAELLFVSRTEYTRLLKGGAALREHEFPDAFTVPEGGNNAAGAAGCEEIAEIAALNGFTHVCAALGTGTTAAGILQGAGNTDLRIGIYPVLKGIAPPFPLTGKTLWRDAWHFGGYARVTDELLQFGLDMYRRFGIPLDPVYTAKLLFGVWQDTAAGLFPQGSRVLVYHSGGMQGARGFPAYYEELCRLGFSLPE